MAVNILTFKFVWNRLFGVNTSYPTLIMFRRYNFSEIDRAGGSNKGMLFEELYRWWLRLKPFKEELSALRNLFLRYKAGFDPPLHGQTRYLVRFSQLSDVEFNKWRVVTDATFELGNSRARFIRSSRLPVDSIYNDQFTSTSAQDLPDSSITGFKRASNNTTCHRDPINTEMNPYSTTYSIDQPKIYKNPASKSSYIDSNLFILNPPKNALNLGYGLFRGFISTKVPKRGDIVRTGFANVYSPEHTIFGFLGHYNFYPYTHIVIRYRGDGRTYFLNIHPDQVWDILWFDIHQIPLYTRGGPYWTIAKIPLSRFFVTNKACILDRQHAIIRTSVRMISFTVDSNSGPFSLEIDYIALYYDEYHREQFAYEQYSTPALSR